MHRCMFGREIESCQMWRWQDSGSHLKREEKAMVVPTLPDQGANGYRGLAQLSAEAGSR